MRKGAFIAFRRERRHLRCVRFGLLLRWFRRLRRGPEANIGGGDHGRNDDERHRGARAHLPRLLVSPEMGDGIGGGAVVSDEVVPGARLNRSDRLSGVAGRFSRPGGDEGRGKFRTIVHRERHASVPAATAASGGRGRRDPRRARRRGAGRRIGRARSTGVGGEPNGSDAIGEDRGEGRGSRRRRGRFRRPGEAIRSGRRWSRRRRGRAGPARRAPPVRNDHEATSDAEHQNG